MANRIQRFHLAIFAYMYVFLSLCLLSLVYRVFFYRELKQVFLDINIFLREIIFHSAKNDFILAAMAASPLLLLYIVKSFKARRAYLGLVSAIVFFYGIFLSLSLLFFTIFETPFQSSFFGGSLGTFKTAMVTSALSEISVAPLHKAWPLLVTSVFTVFTFFVIFNMEKHHRIRQLSITGTFLFFACFVFSVTSAVAVDISAEKLMKFNRGNRLTFHQESLFTNPLGNIIAYAIFSRPTSSDPVLSGANTSSPKGTFIPLNTDSADFPKMHPRLNIERGKRMNIILYFMESTSAQYSAMQYKGRDIMPNLKRLSQRAFVAKNHYANFPLSINTYFTVLSSAYEYPDKLFVPCGYPNIKIKSLFEIMKENKYRTGILHGSSLDNFCRRPYMKNRSVDLQLGFDELNHSEFPPLDKTWQADDRVMIKPTLDFLQNSSQPAFLIVMPISPHHPYLVPEEKFNITKQELANEHSRKKQYWLNYVNSLHFSDHVLGQFMDELKRRNLAENTVVFIFGDHGEAFYQHQGNYLHSLYVYQENVHVPFIVVNPVLFPEKITYEGISRAIDVAPTVLDLLNVKRPKRYEGISLFSAHKQQMAILHAQWADDIMGLVDGKYKFSYRFKDSATELFDLTTDPLEKRNLAEKNPDITKKYKSVILRSRQHGIDFFSRARQGNIL